MDAPRGGVIDHPDVLALFRRQFGVASTAQLVQLGMSYRTVTRARERGALRRVTSKVLLLTSNELTFEARAMAALLHSGRRSFLMGTTAGTIYGLRYMQRERIHVGITRQVNIDVPPWLQASRTTWVIAGDIAEHPTGLRVTHPLRTLLELAGAFNQHRFERAAEDAWKLGLVTPGQAAEYLGRARRQGRSGVSTMEAWLERAIERELPVGSGLEMEALRVFRDVGLPEPVRQHPLALPSGETIHFDIAWPDVRLAVEPGHSWWHGGNLRMHADHARDRACGELGWYVVRFDETMREDLMAAGRQVKRIFTTRRAA